MIEWATARDRWDLLASLVGMVGFPSLRPLLLCDFCGKLKPHERSEHPYHERSEHPYHERSEHPPLQRAAAHSVIQSSDHPIIQSFKNRHRRPVRIRVGRHDVRQPFRVAAAHADGYGEPPPVACFEDVAVAVAAALEGEG